MLFCPICKSDISDPIKQFGWKIPICGSCYQDGLEWAVEDTFLLNELQHGFSLQEAVKLYHIKFQPEKDDGFLQFVWQLCLALEKEC